jgi:hypothetical protein
MPSTKKKRKIRWHFAPVCNLDEDLSDFVLPVTKNLALRQIRKAKLCAGDNYRMFKPGAFQHDKRR